MQKRSPRRLARVPPSPRRPGLGNAAALLTGSPLGGDWSARPSRGTPPANQRRASCPPRVTELGADAYVSPTRGHRLPVTGTHGAATHASARRASHTEDTRQVVKTRREHGNEDSRAARWSRSRLADTTHKHTHTHRRTHAHTYDHHHHQQQRSERRRRSTPGELPRYNILGASNAAATPAHRHTRRPPRRATPPPALPHLLPPSSISTPGPGGGRGV